MTMGREHLGNFRIVWRREEYAEFARTASEDDLGQDQGSVLPEISSDQNNDFRRKQEGEESFAAAGPSEIAP
jgi:hypothetical protein